MSVPDYGQRLIDHQSFLTLVKPLGRRIEPADYRKIYDKIGSVQQICIPPDRLVTIRYKHEYQPEDNEWGDFQFHRRVLGLVCIVQYHADNSLHEVEAHYNSVKSLYSSSLFDSRLILLGVPNVDSLLELAAVSSSLTGELPMKTDHFGGPGDDPGQRATASYQDSGQDLRCGTDSTGERSDFGQVQLEARSRKPLSDVTEKQLLCYESAEACLECVVDDIHDFACSLFYILESKRISASKLQVERQPQLLMAPYERRDVAHVDLESKLFKKRYIGRQRKHVGDLCLLAALYSEAASNYNMALDILKSADDFLWVAGALEGLCCAAFYLHYPSTHEKPSPLLLPRNRSFSTKRGPSTVFQSLGSKLAGAAASTTESGGLDLAGPKVKNLFPADEIGERYREAILQYCKFRPAATALEMEACIKVSRILIHQGKRREVHEFLQRVACVNIDFDDDEKIARWSILADLYNDIGFQRKAAFYKRSAAIECVLSYPPSVPPPRSSWQRCHAMLLQSFPGYKLSLNIKDYGTPAMIGWPVLRHHVFAELARSSVEIGDSRATVRCLCTAMHALFEHLSHNQLKEMSSLIEANSSADEGKGEVQESAASRAAGCDTSQPSQDPMNFPFTKIPVLCEVKIEKLPPHMAPVRRQKDQPSSVFIYTPLEKGPGKRRLLKGGAISTGVTWVEGDFSEVELYVYNPMPYELKLTNIGLVTDGVDFESHPSGHSLPADSGPHLIKVVGTPKSSGTLVIKGYTCNLLGVGIVCLFADLPRLKDACAGYSVEVAPSLPHLHISECGGLPRSPYLVTGGNSELHTSAILRLLYGERKKCLFRIRNVGNEKVETLELALDNKLQSTTSAGNQLLHWSDSEIASQLPLLPGEEAVLALAADAGFVDPSDSASWSAVPMSPQGQWDRQLQERSDSRSSSSLLECTLRMKYSGGQGMAALYHRQCAMAIDIVLDPAVDVLCKEVISSSADEFTLTLAVINRSNVTFDLLLPPSAEAVPRCLKPMDASQISLVGIKRDFFTTDAEVKGYLRELVQITWTSAAAAGRLPSAQLSWSPAELAVARRSAVIVDVSFESGDDVAIPSVCNADEKTLPCFGAGHAVDFNLTLCNRSSRNLTNVKLKADVNQSFVAQSALTSSAVDNGFCVFLEQSSFRLAQCDSGSQHSVPMTLVAFYPGHYTLVAACFNEDNRMMCTATTLDFTVS